MKIKDVLNLKLNNSDFDKDLTIKDYFRDLLITLWREGEGFSGKRPFGNSGWEYDIYKPLIEAGEIEGSLDGNGYVEDVDFIEADKFIIKLIKDTFNE